MVGPKGANKYQGEYENGSANGFGRMTYANGDQALGYWKNGMLHSDEEKGEACIYQRAEKNGAFFLGNFKFDCAVEGRLFKHVDDEGGNLKKFDKDNLVKVDTSDFWDIIMPWTTIPLQEYVVLYAWTEHVSEQKKKLEFRYYWNDRKMVSCNTEGRRYIDTSDKKETAEERFKEIITEKKYTITEQKIDFSGNDSCIVETRQYPQGNVRKWELNQYI